MTTSAPTIIDLKAAFLRKQIHILSQPLQPTADFYASQQSSETKLSLRAIETALEKVNQRLKRHNRLAYGIRAQRHIAEQIDRLYLDTTSRTQLGNEVDKSRPELGTDFCASEIIDQLPKEWSEDDEESDTEEQEKVIKSSGTLLEQKKQRQTILPQHFFDLRSSLAEKNARRNDLKQRIEKYKALRDGLRSFDDSLGLQQNLVTRGGELEQELERMCRLMLRVERGLSSSGLARRNIEINEESDNEMDLDSHEELNVLKILS